MTNIESARPTRCKILAHIEEFEKFCTGQKKHTPSEFRKVNRELSIGTALLIGKHRYQRDEEGKRLIWRGLDNKEYDLGHIHDANIMRDYPGFHARHCQSLSANSVQESKVIRIADGKKSITTVTMQDGSTGIGPNYRMALRNAALKMHFKKEFNTFSLSNLWNQVWGHA